MKCSRCNQEYDSSLRACPNCGEPNPLDTEPGLRSSADNAPDSRMQAQPESSASGNAALVLGILSLLIPVIGIALGIVAIVLGGKQKRTFPQGTPQYTLGMTGWILGIIGVVLRSADLISRIV